MPTSSWTYGGTECPLPARRGPRSSRPPLAGIKARAVEKQRAGDGSGTLDFEPATDCGGDPFEVVRVGTDDKIAAAQRSFNDAGVDDVRGARPGRQRPDRPRLAIVEGLDVAADEQSGQQRLPASSPPALRDNRCRHGRDFPQ